MYKREKPIVKCKYGIFVHFVVPHVIYADGRKPTDINELIDGFDAEGFVHQVVDTGTEYLILTAWNFGTVPLYPSPVTDKWRTFSSPRRDLLSEIVDGLIEQGVQVVLYTHPRDGHDFEDEDRIRTGWGIGHYENILSCPNPETFNYTRWNTYIRELYTELIEKYGDRISGIYLDGEGPKMPWDFRNSDSSFQIVDYLMIRDIIKAKNPELILFQNFFGSLFSVDYANAEEYNSYVKYYLKYKHVEKWHTAKIATPMTAFLGSWGVDDKSVYGKYAPFMTSDNMARYTMFNASCSESGGVTWASGPFAEGSIWPVGVMESLRDTGKILSEFRESILDAGVSCSYPTISGDTLEELDFRFWMTGENEKYEYLHCMRMPSDGLLSWGEPEDGITLADPEVIRGEMMIQSFEKTEDRYSMMLEGKPDTLDTVIRFTRMGTSHRAAYQWINDTDKRIDYREGWHYYTLMAQKDGNVFDDAKGCYDRDMHLTWERTSLFFAFQGSILEIYGSRDERAGSAEIYIDGVCQGTMRQYSEIREARVCCFRSINLHGGCHILQLYTHGDGNVCLDALKVIE